MKFSWCEPDLIVRARWRPGAIRLRISRYKSQRTCPLEPFARQFLDLGEAIKTGRKPLVR